MYIKKSFFLSLGCVEKYSDTGWNYSCRYRGRKRVRELTRDRYLYWNHVRGRRRSDVKSATCIIHIRRASWCAVYFCDLLFSRVLKIANDFWHECRLRRLVIRLITRFRKVRKDDLVDFFHFNVLLLEPLMEQNGKHVYSRARPPAFFVAYSNFRSWDFIY